MTLKSTPPKKNFWIVIYIFYFFYLFLLSDTFNSIIDGLKHDYWLIINSFFPHTRKALSTECRETKPLVITVANQNIGKKYKEPMRTQSKNSQTVWSAGKHVWPSRAWLVSGLHPTDWWRKWHESSWPIIEQRRVNSMKSRISFDTQFKTCTNTWPKINDCFWSRLIVLTNWNRYLTYI